MLAPGLGSSEHIGLLDGSSADRLTTLYRLTRAGQPVAELPAGSELVATLHLLDSAGDPTRRVPGWERRRILPTRLSELAAGAAPKSDRLPEAWVVELDVHATLAPLRGDGGPTAPFGFGSLFSERFRLDLALEVEGTAVCSDAIELQVFDAQKFGSLYQRVSSLLLPHDMARQIAARNGPETLDVSYHPWFPVLCIGVEKANLYMKAIRGDVLEQKRMLTDPAWLLRVGLYLELLTCLGIFEVVKEELDLLSAEERDLFESSPRFAELRRRIDRVAWSEVWELRTVSFLRTPGMDSPVGVQNLLKKRAATLAFLRAHHEDLKHAIELAGANLVNAQETWHRVFRDAERAVLKMNRAAFPELDALPERLRNFVLWHRQGKLAGFTLPAFLAGPVGDQDGLFPSACAQYRASMNEVAEWAAENGLMEYTGSECVPRSVSVLESYLAGSHGRLAQLQERDGYLGTLDVRDCDEVDERLPVEEILSLIGGIGLFEVLTADELAELARQARPIELGPHERIIVQGNPGSSLFVVHEGELEVIVREGGKESLLANLGRAAVVGEMSFLTGQKRAATVRARDAAIVVEIAAAHLRPIVERRPALLQELTRLMQRRQRKEDEAGAAETLLELVASAILAHAPEG